MSRTSNLSGIAAMLAATAVFVVSDSFMKLVTEDLPPFEVLFLRAIAASLACAVLVTLQGEWRVIAGIFNSRALLRAVGETLATLCYVVALTRLPIADVIAILQIGPLFVILGATAMLRERVGPARIGLVLVGFVGALMVAQPSTKGISTAVLLAFATAVLGAVRDIAGRSVPLHIPVTVVNFATMLMMIIAAGAMSLGFETRMTPTGHHLAFLGLAGVFVTLGHAGLLLAYRLGQAAVIAPFFYSFALWGVLSGLIVWHAWPRPLALAGIALVALSGVSMVLLDQRRGGSEGA